MPFKNPDRKKQNDTDWVNNNREKVRGYKKSYRERNVPNVRSDRKNRVAEKRKWLADYKETCGCTDCKGKFQSFVLDFDHLDADQKIMNVGRLVNYGWDKLKAEVVKCEVVCANCHRIRTHERRMKLSEPSLVERLEEVHG